MELFKDCNVLYLSIEDIIIPRNMDIEDVTIGHTTIDCRLADIVIFSYYNGYNKRIYKILKSRY